MTPSATTQNGLTLASRALIALLFIPAGFSKIGGFERTVGYIGSKGLPLPELGAVIAVVVELGLGLMLLAGFKTRFSALGLAVFTLVASYFFHAFWAVPDAQVMQQQQAFFKNLAIVGGLLALVAWGPGGFSVDARTRRA